MPFPYKGFKYDINFVIIVLIFEKYTCTSIGKAKCTRYIEYIPSCRYNENMASFYNTI